MLVASVQFTEGGRATSAAIEATAAMFDKEVEEVADSPLLLIGTPAEMAETLRQRRQRWGFNYIVLQTENCDLAARRSPPTRARSQRNSYQIW